MVPEIFKILTAEAGDPDVHIHQWLTGNVPLGITAPIEPGVGVPLCPSPESWQGERSSTLSARVEADKLLKKEVQSGYVQWCSNRAELEHWVGTLQLAKIAVLVKGTKIRLIHDLRRNGTNARVTFRERLVLPRVDDLITAIMELLQRQVSGEGLELLTLDFRDAFKQLHVVPSERPFLAGAAMNGFFSYRTVLFGVGSGPNVWCRVAAWVMWSTQAWLGADRAQTNCFVDDPIITLRGTSIQRRRMAMEVLLWWTTLGLKLVYEKGSFGPDAVWIGTHFLVNSVVNKVEISLPAKKNADLLGTLEEIMDNASIRKLAGKESWVAGVLPQLKPFGRQLWASLYKERMDQKVELVASPHMVEEVPPAHQQVLVRRLFLVDRLLDGLVLEVDASTTGGGAAWWVGARHVAHSNPPVAYGVTQWTAEDEALLGSERRDPAHQATWEAFMVLLAIRHFVTVQVRGRIVLVGDALGVWFGMVRFCAKSKKINEIAKEVAMHLAPLGHELEGCTFGVK